MWRGVGGGGRLTCIQYVDSWLHCTILYIQHRARPHSSSRVEHLEQRLDDLETLRKYCGSKMDSQLGEESVGVGVHHTWVQWDTPSPGNSFWNCHLDVATPGV